jgi:hypothetical protein
MSAMQSHAPRSARIAGVIALLVLQAGCAKEAMRPDVTEVQLSVAAGPAIGSPSRPVAIDVRATNGGNMPVWRCEGCGCGNRSTGSPEASGAGPHRES